MLVDDPFRKQGCEPKPVGMRVAKESVIGILGEILLEAASFLLHIHTPVTEYITEDIGEQLHESNSLFLFAAALFQKGSDLKIMDKSGDGI